MENTSAPRPRLIKDLNFMSGFWHARQRRLEGVSTAVWGGLHHTLGGVRGPRCGGLQRLL